MNLPVPPLASSIAQYLSSAQFVFYSRTQPEGGMKFRVQLVIESNDDRPGVVEEIGVSSAASCGPRISV
jgi:hypothetical protein